MSDDKGLTVSIAPGSDMPKTVEYTGVNNRVSPATVELLIHERNEGKTLRQLGRMFNRSYESIRQILAKYDPLPESLIPERRVAAKLGYPWWWLAQLRKEGIINPIKQGFWRYSEEQIRQIPSLIAELRKCQRCGKPRPPGSYKFCKECRQYTKKYRYRLLSPEAKAKYIERQGTAEGKSSAFR